MTKYLNDDQIKKMRTLRLRGGTWPAIGKKFNVCGPTAKKYVQAVFGEVLPTKPIGRGRPIKGDTRTYCPYMKRCEGKYNKKCDYTNKICYVIQKNHKACWVYQRAVRRHIMPTTPEMIEQVEKLKQLVVKGYSK